MNTENMENIKSLTVRDEIYDNLNDLNLNIDVDVPFLAGQTPPIKVFPTQNTSNLPYNEQLSLLESDYLKYYTYRGDLKYNGKMARSIKKEGKGKCSEEETCMYRVCRDKHRFFETRIKDDALILGKILEAMAERTSEMEKYLEKVLVKSGEKKMPKWDELFNSDADNSSKMNAKDEKNKPSNDLKATKSVGAAKRKERDVKSVEPKSKAKRRKSNSHSQPSTMTPEQARMIVAQLMLARGNSQPNRVHLPPKYIDSVIHVSNEEQPIKEE